MVQNNLLTYLFALLVCSAALTHLLARSLTSLTTSLVGKWIIRWLFFMCIFFYYGTYWDDSTSLSRAFMIAPRDDPCLTRAFQIGLEILRGYLFFLYKSVSKFALPSVIFNRWEWPAVKKWWNDVLCMDQFCRMQKKNVMQMFHRKSFFAWQWQKISWKCRVITNSSKAPVRSREKVEMM